jgi:hypothetical protein
MRILLFFMPVLFLFIACGNSLEEGVWVYNYPGTIINGNHAEHSRSKLIDVKIEQNNMSYNAYVMYDKNQEPVNNLSLNPDNHWTNFSMTGKARVKVSRLDGKAITKCRILPAQKGIDVVVENNMAIFEIDESQLPLQVNVEMNDLGNNVLLIFADPKETDVPDKNGNNVEMIYTSDDIETVKSKLQSPKTYKYFEPGIHQWGSKTGNDYQGYKLPIVEGKKIYIPGGAYVIGSFSGDEVGNYKIYGRGILSLAGKDRLAGTRGIPFSTVYSSGSGKNQTLEGFVSLCPPHFHLTVRGEVIIDNVKMLSWWHQSDGIVTGDNSKVINCFYKVMDDVIKIYSDNGYYENNTIFQQVNGAPFQLSWGNQQSKNNVVKNTYIVNSIFKKQDTVSNTAVINARIGRDGFTSENNLWDGIFIDNGCHRLIGINGNGGIYKNFDIRNVTINSGNKNKPQDLWSYLLGANISNIKISNLTIDGHLIKGLSAEGDNLPETGLMWYSGENKDALIFPE